jgi:hypothetical protein
MDKETFDSRARIRNGYFRWLCGLTKNPEKYRKLLFRLYYTNFHSKIPRDDNRAQDGIELRKRYLESIGFDIQEGMLYLNGSCTVLEMMLALAKRIDSEIVPDFTAGDRSDYWFWRMIDNLNLTRMTDDVYSKEETDVILKILLNRTYDDDGNGSLFPLKKCDKSCDKSAKKVEIWYQMQHWVLENYKI